MKRPIDYVFDAIESKIMTPFQKALALTGCLILVAVLLLAVPMPEAVKERERAERSGIPSAANAAANASASTAASQTAAEPADTAAP